MKLSIFGKATVLVACSFAFGFTAQASTISITFAGAPTGVTNGPYYVMPYLLSIDGILTTAICYDIFDDVSVGQSWTANELTLDQAVSSGQFSNDTNALVGYEQVGFLFEQTTSSPQNQVDLQQDIWNVFDPGRYAVSPGMQAYLDLLATPAYANFNYGTVRFLEDVNQGTGRAQAFVIDPPDAPEPGTIALMSCGALLIGLGRMRRRKLD